MELNLDRILAIVGIVLAIVLVVLDKAGKLRGPVLFVLLAAAALMTLPLALGNSWVKDTPWGMLKFSKVALMVSLVAVCFSACAIWISEPIETEDKRATQSSKAESKSPVAAPKLIATGKSEIVARLYMRGMMPLPPATKAEFSPIFQEIFYDWILTLEPEGPPGDISIILKEPRKHKESVKIMPDIATVSGPTGKWMSGFQENARQNPDFYETTIRFPEGLDKDRPAKIVFRRPIKIGDQATFTLQDFSRTLEVSVRKADVIRNYYEETKQFELISLQLRTLLGWKYSGANSPPVPIRENPNKPLPPLGRGEIETTLEVRCDNEAIGKKVVVQQLEARKKDF